MKIRGIKILIFLFTVNFSTAQDVKNESKTKIDEEGFERSHCFIKSVFKDGTSHFVIVDFVDFLIGEDAVAKALEQGKAEYDITEKNDTTYYVYNDYYISNINPKLRTLKIFESIQIELLDFSGKSESGYKYVTIEELMKEYENHSLVIIKFKNGKVLEIKEQFTP